MEIPQYVLDAQVAFRAGKEYPSRYYFGDIIPEHIGDVAYDPDEGCWVIRNAAEDIEFSCGIDCCGIETYAVLQIEE